MIYKISEFGFDDIYYDDWQTAKNVFLKLFAKGSKVSLLRVRNGI